MLNIKFKEMKKLEISEMEGVFGGMSVDCKALQALADAYAKDGATNRQWDEWCDAYEAHGC
ncbi:hypothetical protein PRRU23_21190 [Segatella bryantii]|nr:hypothetical protein PRRU23_21190 [Segatella bryantii]